MSKQVKAEMKRREAEEIAASESCRIATEQALSAPSTQISQERLDELLRIEQELKKSLAEAQEKARLEKLAREAQAIYIELLKRTLKTQTDKKSGVVTYNKTCAIYKDMAHRLLFDLNYVPTEDAAKAASLGVCIQGETYGSWSQPFKEGQFMLSLFAETLHKVSAELESQGIDFPTLLRRHSLVFVAASQVKSSDLTK